MIKEKILKELQLKAVRSSGPGGQHVNKVSSKVALTFAVQASNGLTDSEKERLLVKLGPRLTNDGVLLLHCDEARSQHKNKELVIQRLFKLLQKALVVPKKRKPTKPTRSSVEKRLKSKKKDSDKKVNRKKPNWD